MDLIEAEMLTEQGAGFAELTAQSRYAQILNLVGLRVDPPTARVSVPPLRPHGYLAGRYPALRQPRGEELLGIAVGTGSIEVAYSRLVCRIQQGVRQAPQRLDASVRPQVLGSAERDVRGRPRAARPRPIGPKGSWARPSLLRSPSRVCARSEGDDVMASASNPCPATADTPSLGEPALTLGKESRCPPAQAHQLRG